MRESFIKSDELALWFFRFNGLLTIGNFILHPDVSGSARTDADIVGVRFPYRSEFPAGDGGDDVWFQSQNAQPVVILAEVKTTQCALNGPWSDPAKRNINKVLSDLGWYQSEEVSKAAATLYSSGLYEGAIRTSLFCIGETRNEQLRQRYPLVPQRTWSEVIGWIHRRFDRHEDRKADHGQWNSAGQELWRSFTPAQSSQDFEKRVRRAFLLRAG